MTSPWQRLPTLPASLSHPPDVAVLIKPTDDIAESPMEVVRLPSSVTTRVYDDSNPPIAERETHSEAPINAGIALPLLLELDLVNWIAQFRNEPLHLESRFSWFFQAETVPRFSVPPTRCLAQALRGCGSVESSQCR